MARENALVPRFLTNDFRNCPAHVLPYRGGYPAANAPRERSVRVFRDAFDVLLWDLGFLIFALFRLMTRRHGSP